MNGVLVREVCKSIFPGLVFLVVITGTCLFLTQLNRYVLPAVPWFFLASLVVSVGATIWAEKRFGIGLYGRPRLAWSRVWAITLAVTLAGVGVCILEGAYHGMIRAAETVPTLSTSFQITYALGVSVIVALVAEVAFRGLMQTALQKLLNPWWVLILVSALNTASHRYGRDLAQQWLGYFVSLLGLGYVRWVAGSLLPPLVAHMSVNLLLACTLWYHGSMNQGVIAPRLLLIIGVTSAVAGAAAVALGGINGPSPPSKGGQPSVFASHTH